VRSTHLQQDPGFRISSKWNPIEHRLFGPISLNWAGTPLQTWDAILAYLRGTTTTTGLAVRAFLHDKVYAAGRSVTAAAMQALNLEYDVLCPRWNYTLRPRECGCQISVTPSIREVMV